jgi:hypothetical protein
MMPPMRRAARHVFTILSALSLLMSVATCVLWVRSYFREDRITRYSNVGTDLQMVGIDCMSDTGQLLVMHSTWRADHRPSVKPPLDSTHAGPATGHPENVRWFQNVGRYWRGFGIVTAMNGTGSIKTNGTTYTQTGALRFIFPHWAVVMPLAVLPMMWLLLKVRRARRVAAGACPVCGYDLRASPDRCPECGTARPAITQSP